MKNNKVKRPLGNLNVENSTEEPKGNKIIQLKQQLERKDF